MKTLLIKLVVIVVGAFLLVLWKNFLGVKIEGTMIARIAYMVGVGLFALAISNAAQQSVQPTLLESRDLNLFCPLCGGQFDIELPASQRG